MMLQIIQFKFQFAIQIMHYTNDDKIQSKGPELKSQSVGRNTVIFGVLLLLVHIGFSIIYGILIKIPPIPININSIIVNTGLALLVIGFGLLFGYLRKMIWSGLGFTFLILALSIEMYPLINAFWIKAQIQTDFEPLTDFSEDKKYYNLFLTNRQTQDQYISTNANQYGNCISNAIKCALSIAVAFSSILGRAGQLQCLLVTLFGVVGFELNRQIIQEMQGADVFGSFYIFTYGGFLGLVLGLWMKLRETKDNCEVNNHSLRLYNGSTHSVPIATLGALIIFACFPFLAFEFDGYIFTNDFSAYIGPLCVIVAMGAGTLGSILISALINGYIISRDAIHGPIAGAIAVGASSLYITNPNYAILAGVSGGIIQSLIQNIIERQAIKKNLIISTVSWSLFGVQGIVGAAFAAGWKAIAYQSQNGLNLNPTVLNNFTSQFQFYAGLISAGIGSAFGLGIGLILFLINQQGPYDHFDDYTYWIKDDGYHFLIAEKSEQARSTTPSDIAFSIGSEIKNTNAYL